MITLSTHVNSYGQAFRIISWHPDPLHGALCAALWVEHETSHRNQTRQLSSLRNNALFHSERGPSVRSLSKLRINNAVQLTCFSVKVITDVIMWTHISILCQCTENLHWCVPVIYEICVNLWMNWFQEIQQVIQIMQNLWLIDWCLTQTLAVFRGVNKFYY